MSESTLVYVGCKLCRACDMLKPLGNFSRRSSGHASICKSCASAGREPLDLVPEKAPTRGCTSCGETKPINEFGWRGKYRQRICKKCVAYSNQTRYGSRPDVREKHRTLRDRWRGENPTYRAEYYEDNRARIIASVIEYARLNPVDPEVKRSRDRAWYAATREVRQAVDAAWRKANAELVREVGRRSQSRRRARLRDLPVEPYTLDEVVARDGTKCLLCGEELDFFAAHPDLLAPTIEHLECISWPDSAGDVLANVALSHFTCNCQRGDRPHPAAARKRAELLTAEQLT